MFAGRISRLALFGTNLAAASYATLKLRANFFAGSFFERITATGAEEDASYRDQERKGPHPLILGMKWTKATRQDLSDANRKILLTNPV